MKRNKREKKRWKQHKSCIKTTEQDLTALETLLHSLRKEQVQCNLHHIQLESHIKKLDKQLELFDCGILQRQPDQRRKKEIKRRIKQKRKEFVECENQLQTSQVLLHSLVQELDSGILERVHKEVDELKQIEMLLHTIEKDYSVYTVLQ